MNEEDIKSCHDALMRAIEEENKKMDRRNIWRKRLKILMILGVLLAFQLSRYWLLQNRCLLVL